MSEVDRVDARLTGLEAAVEKMDTRFGELNGRMNERFNLLRRSSGRTATDRGTTSPKSR